MPSAIVRISAESRETLRRLAREEGKPMQSVLDKAVERYRREKLLAGCKRRFWRSGVFLGAGIGFFFRGVFYSSLVEGEFTSMVAGLFSIYLIFTSQDFLYRWLPYFSMGRLLSGADVVDRATGFVTAFPWSGVLKSLVAAALL
jgi:hypothetical protein